MTRIQPEFTWVQTIKWISSSLKPGDSKASRYKPRFKHIICWTRSLKSFKRLRPTNNSKTLGRNLKKLCYILKHNTKGTLVIRLRNTKYTMIKKTSKYIGIKRNKKYIMIKTEKKKAKARRKKWNFLIALHLKLKRSSL